MYISALLAAAAVSMVAASPLALDKRDGVVTDGGPGDFNVIAMQFSCSGAACRYSFQVYITNDQHNGWSPYHPGITDQRLYCSGDQESTTGDQLYRRCQFYGQPLSDQTVEAYIGSDSELNLRYNYTMPYNGYSYQFTYTGAKYVTPGNGTYDLPKFPETGAFWVRV